MKHVSYEVKLDVYEGPIDLLLHLITRQRVDIYDVSLATITEEFLAAVDALDVGDLENATGFLIVAATLLDLKSARLLPGRDADVDDALLEERDLLLARLVECATFREAGTWINAGLAEGSAFHGRMAGLEPHLVGLAPDLLAGVGPDRLVATAADMLAPRSEPSLDMSHVAPIRASVRDAISELAGRLIHTDVVSFADLCSAAERIQVVVRFLALLELYKAGAVELDQVDRFGDIQARWTGEVALEEVIADADEYAVTEGEARS